MNIYIGADHNGFDLKEKLKDYLSAQGHTIVDKGGIQHDPADDFPLFASKVVHAMQADEEDEAEVRGILICGSGQGMVMAANRFKGVRAGLGWSTKAARSIRHDEDSNVLALPAEVLDEGDLWKEVVDTWLTTEFGAADRFKRRNHQLDNLGN